MTDEHDPLRWHHRPEHRFVCGCAYMITSGTLHKKHIFVGDERLALLEEALFATADRYCWRLQAWALFSNHYHVIALAPAHVESLRGWIQRLHSASAIGVNRHDGTPGRRVWFEYWDTCLTFESSYYARLNYVLSNAVKHGIATKAEDYGWCSAGWFGKTADPAFARKVSSYRWERVNVADQF